MRLALEFAEQREVNEVRGFDEQARVAARDHDYVVTERAYCVARVRLQKRRRRNEVDQMCLLLKQKTIEF